MRHSMTMPCILHFQGYEKNILPFVSPELRPISAKIHGLKLPNMKKDLIEKLGSFLPPIRDHVLLKHAFWRGITAVLSFLLLLVLNIGV